MNYVSHTRAAHQQLANQADARPHHVSLYWALFFQWNTLFFEGPVELDSAATMRAARIGNERTYRTTLYDLHSWGLITYQPSQSRHHPSTCRIADLSGAEVPPVKGVTGSRSARSKTALPGAEVPEALRAEVPPIEGLPGAEVPEDTLYVKPFLKPVHQNVGGGTKKNRGEGFADDGLSGAEVLDDNALPDDAGPPRSAGPGAAPKDSAHQADQVAPKRKGVKQATVRAAAQAQAADGPAPRRKGAARQLKPEVLFTESELATYEQFAAAFAGTDYELADLRFYHEKVRNWRKQGEEPRRRDWKATATQFFLNDAQDNRLKLAPGVQHHNGTSAGAGQPGGPAAEYRSSRWD